MAIPPTGLIGSEQALQQGLTNQLGLIGQGVGSAQGEIDLATQQARQDISQGFQQAQAPLNPFTQAGTAANQQQAALSGALGPRAQQQAYANFRSSPGQEYLLEQAEQASIRNAAATGGLGGGNVQRELQRQAMGLAQQDYQNQFNNLGQIAGRGVGTAGMQSGLSAQQGQNLANISQAAGSNLANLAFQGGTIPAQMVGNTASQLAQGRFGAGQLLANQAAQTTTNLANLQNQQGTGMANQYGQAATNLANLVSQAGQGSANLQQNLATILSNIATQQGSGQANLTQAAGAYDAAGILGQNQAVQNTLQPLMQLASQYAYSQQGVPINQALANQTGTITPRY